jgi:hypothetical protein
MRAFLVPLALTCLLLSETPSSSQTGKPQSETANLPGATIHVAATGDTCVFESRKDIADYPNCVFQDDHGNLFIAQKYIEELQFDSYGLAVVFHEVHTGHLFMYVDRKGHVVVKDVPVADNWAEKFSDGLVPFVVNKKFGYADRQGKIVIEPKYDGYSQFENGYAVVCVGCRETCAPTEPPETMPECEHRISTGGEWYKIDKQGRVVATVPHE